MTRIHTGSYKHGMTELEKAAAEYRTAHAEAVSLNRKSNELSEALKLVNERIPVVVDRVEKARLALIDAALGKRHTLKE